MQIKKSIIVLFLGMILLISIMFFVNAAPLDCWTETLTVGRAKMDIGIIWQKEITKLVCFNI